MLTNHEDTSYRTINVPPAPVLENQAGATPSPLVPREPPKAGPITWSTRRAPEKQSHEAREVDPRRI